MIKIKKINQTKCIYHYNIIINGWFVLDEDLKTPIFYRKKDAQKFIDNNINKLKELEQSIKYKPESPFDVPSEISDFLLKHHNTKRGKNVS